MHRSGAISVTVALLLSALGCSSGGSEGAATLGVDASIAEVGGPDAGGADASGALEASADDDAANTRDASDAGPDANDILGTLSGECGAIRALLASPDPSLEDNLVTFVAGEAYDDASLSPDGVRLKATSNAGGSSTESEVMSFEVLHYCEGASLLKTETEIGYAPPDDAGANTITDILVAIDGKKVGVSVTRAYKPSTMPLTDADVKTLLEKKLAGVIRSSQRVLPADKWVKQILHVFAVDQAASDAVDRVWKTLDPALRADTIVLVTRTKGGGFIYCDKPDPPLGSECP